MSATKEILPAIMADKCVAPQKSGQNFSEIILMREIFMLLVQNTKLFSITFFNLYNIQKFLRMIVKVKITIFVDVKI